MGQTLSEPVVEKVRVIALPDSPVSRSRDALGCPLPKLAPHCHNILLFNQTEMELTES